MELSHIFSKKTLFLYFWNRTFLKNFLYFRSELSEFKKKKKKPLRWELAKPEKKFLYFPKKVLSTIWCDC